MRGGGDDVKLGHVVTELLVVDTGPPSTTTNRGGGDVCGGPQLVRERDDTDMREELLCEDRVDAVL
jgi:hypothetical protein